MGWGESTSPSDPEGQREARLLGYLTNAITKIEEALDGLSEQEDTARVVRAALEEGRLLPPDLEEAVRRRQRQPDPLDLNEPGGHVV